MALWYCVGNLLLMEDLVTGICAWIQYFMILIDFFEYSEVPIILGVLNANMYSCKCRKTVEKCWKAKFQIQNFYKCIKDIDQMSSRPSFWSHLAVSFQVKLYKKFVASSHLVSLRFVRGVLFESNCFWTKYDLIETLILFYVNLKVNEFISYFHSCCRIFISSGYCDNIQKKCLMIQNKICKGKLAFLVDESFLRLNSNEVTT